MFAFARLSTFVFVLEAMEWFAFAGFLPPRGAGLTVSGWRSSLFRGSVIWFDQANVEVSVNYLLKSNPPPDAPVQQVPRHFCRHLSALFSVPTSPLNWIRALIRHAAGRYSHRPHSPQTAQHFWTLAATAMDIALELCDKYFFDHVYAALLPVQTAPYNLGNGVINSTAFDPKASSPWEYHPASTFLSFAPGDAAYMSQWTRDNTWRQLITLYIITWSVLHMSSLHISLTYP